MSGLPKQTVEIPLGQGLETDVDPKLLPVGKVTTSENVIWTATGGTGTAVKRPGYVPVGSTYAGSANPMPAAWQLAQHKGSSVWLSKAGVRPVGVYSQTLNQYVAPQALASDAPTAIQSRLRGQVTATRQPAFRGNSGGGATSFCSFVDTATDGVFMLVTWLFVPPTGSASIQARIVELATGNVLFQSTVVSGLVSIMGPPHAVYANGALSLVYMVSTSTGHMSEIHWLTSDLGTGNGTPSGPQGLAVDVFANIGDVQAQGTNVQIIYIATGPATKRIVYPGGSPGSSTTTTILSASSAAITGSVMWVTDLGGTGKQAIISANGSGLTLHYDIASGTAVASTVLDATAGPYWSMVAYTLNSSGDVMAVSQIRGQPGPIRLAWKVGASTNSQVWLNSTSLMSKPFSHNGDFFVSIAYESQEQGTDFVIRVPSKFSGSALDSADYTQAPSARYCSATGNGSDGSIASVAAMSNGSSYVSGCIVRTREITTAAGTFFDTGVDILTVQFDPVTIGTAREYADSTYVCGGLLAAFDGRTLAEEGFHVYPDAPVLTQTTGGSLTLLGTYYVCSVYRVTDNNGRVHRSSPSDVVAIALTGTNRTIIATQKTLKLTGRPGQVAIEYYRVKNAGDLPVQLFLNQVVANVETTDTATITDVASDASMATAMPMYTSPDPTQLGPLASGPPPSPLAMCVFKQRLACIDADDRTLVRISLPLTDFDGEGWPIFDIDQVSSFRIEDVHGDLTACATMDDKLITFKNDAIYMNNGDGPDVTGNGTWGVTQIVSTGIGCAFPRTIVETPDGIVFYSTSKRAGYYLLNRGLALQYIGAPIQAYLGQDTVIDGIYVPSSSRVMFFGAQGNTRVFDQALTKLTGQPEWTTFTNQLAGSAGLLNGLPLYQKPSGGALLTEDASGIHWDENGTANDQYLLTPWLSLAGLKGYERFYKLQGIGTWLADHTLTVTMYTNFNDGAPFQTRSIQMTVAAGNQDWNLWELQHPNKATAVRFGIRISRASGAVADTAGANVSSIVIEYGAHQGLRPMPNASRLT